MRGKCRPWDRASAKGGVFPLKTGRRGGVIKQSIDVNVHKM